MIRTQAMIALVMLGGVAHADADTTVHMAPNQQLAIGRRVYVCVHAEHANGDAIVLASGDLLTVGAKRLACDDGLQDPPGPDPVEVTSFVEPGCIGAVAGALAGHGSATDLALACRNVAVGDHRCKRTHTEDDPSCAAALEVSGVHAASPAATKKACERTVSSCQLDGDPVSSTIDLACFEQLTHSAPHPSDATVAGWVRVCQTGNSRGCVAIDGAFDASCFAQALELLGGHGNATSLAVACHTHEMRCPP